MFGLGIYPLVASTAAREESSGNFSVGIMARAFEISAILAAFSLAVIACMPIDIVTHLAMGAQNSRLLIMLSIIWGWALGMLSLIGYYLIGKSRQQVSYLLSAAVVGALPCLALAGGGVSGLGVEACLSINCGILAVLAAAIVIRMTRSFRPVKMGYLQIISQAAPRTMGDVGLQFLLTSPCIIFFGSSSSKAAAAAFAVSLLTAASTLVAPLMALLTKPALELSSKNFTKISGKIIFVGIALIVFISAAGFAGGIVILSAKNYLTAVAIPDSALNEMLPLTLAGCGGFVVALACRTVIEPMYKTPVYGIVLTIIALGSYWHIGANRTASDMLKGIIFPSTMALLSALLVTLIAYKPTKAAT